MAIILHREIAHIHLKSFGWRALLISGVRYPLRELVDDAQVNKSMGN